MGQDCYIDITLKSEHTKENIQKILQRGSLLGFVYRDHDINGKYWDAPIINACQAAKKILLELENKKDFGPRVLTYLDPEVNVSLWFYKEDNTNIKFGIGAFGDDSKKRGYYIDLAYYGPLFLSLCIDFMVLKVDAAFMLDYLKFFKNNL